METVRVHRYVWTISNVVSLLLLIALFILWYKVHHYHKPYFPQLTSSEKVQNYLAQTWEKQYTLSKPLYIKTGILVNTLSFYAPHALFVSGYIWQHIPHHLEDGLKPQFFLPDKIGLNKQTIIFQEHYAFPDEEIVQTSFEGLIRQTFDYEKYPFDDKVVQIIILPLQINKNIVFVPDLQSYQNPASTAKLGIDADIILDNFRIQETYFGYMHTHYETDFGIPNFIEKTGYPMFYFAIALKRSLFSAVIAHVLPLVIVIILLFSILMMNSEREDRFIKFNFSGTMVVSACAALFFVLVIVHGNLRNQIYSDQVMYLEYFYFLAYILLALVVLNNYVLLSASTKNIRFIHYDDNLWPKALFWPSILLMTLLISLKVLF